MAKGWYNQPRRHGLAARGIKTAVPKNLASMKADKDYFVPSHLTMTVKGEKIIIKNNKTGRTIELPANGDYDRDGIINRLDCDPLDPEMQGFFDSLKGKVQGIIKKYDNQKEIILDESYWKNEQKISRIRKSLEEKEEKLERKKESQLIRLKSKVAEKKAAQKIREQEKEIDRLQSELEEGTNKQKAKLLAKSAAKRGILLLQRKISGKKTKLTKEELKRTSPKTLKKLEKQQRTNSELETKITIKKLEQREKELQEELSRLNKRK